MSDCLRSNDAHALSFRKKYTSTGSPYGVASFCVIMMSSAGFTSGWVRIYVVTYARKIWMLVIWWAGSSGDEVSPDPVAVLM